MATVQYYIGTVRGTFVGDKDKDFYIPKPYIYNTISMSDLATHIALDSQVERARVQVIIDSLLKQIQEMVMNGHPIDIPHLGRFKPALRSKQAINELYFDINQTSVRVVFQPCRELKDDLKTVKLSKVGDEALVSQDETENMMPGFWYTSDAGDRRRKVMTVKYSSDHLASYYLMLVDMVGPEVEAKPIAFKPEWIGKYVTAAETAGENEVTKAEILASAILCDQTYGELEDDKIRCIEAAEALDFFIANHLPITGKTIGKSSWGVITTNKQQLKEEEEAAATTEP